MKRTVLALAAAITALTAAGSASAYIDVGSKITKRNMTWGLWIERTYQVHSVSTVGHPPGQCWWIATLCGVSVKRHSSGSMAVASLMMDIQPPDSMGMGTLTDPTNIALSYGPHSFTIPQAMFNDPDGILSGDFFLESPGFFDINVPPIFGVPVPYSGGFESGFAFSIGDGVLFAQDDPDWNPRFEGEVFLVPAPAAVGSISMLVFAGLARRRR